MANSAPIRSGARQAAWAIDRTTGSTFHRCWLASATIRQQNADLGPHTTAQQNKRQGVSYLPAQQQLLDFLNCVHGPPVDRVNQITHLHTGSRGSALWF